MKKYQRNEMSREDFVAILIKETERVVKEYKELLHEKNRLEMLNARSLEYLGQINAFLVSEGYEPVSLEENEVEGEKSYEE